MASVSRCKVVHVRYVPNNITFFSCSCISATSVIVSVHDDPSTAEEHFSDPFFRNRLKQVLLHFTQSVG